jgi:hypothetical protein
MPTGEICVVGSVEAAGGDLLLRRRLADTPLPWTLTTIHSDYFLSRGVLMDLFNALPTGGLLTQGLCKVLA